MRPSLDASFELLRVKISGMPSPTERAGPAGGLSPLTHTVLPIPVQPPPRWAHTLVASLGVDTALLTAAVVHATLIHVWKHRQESEGRRGWKPPAQATPRTRDQEAPDPSPDWQRSRESDISPPPPQGKPWLLASLSFSSWRVGTSLKEATRDSSSSDQKPPLGKV